jgi:hypothetical protein
MSPWPKANAAFVETMGNGAVTAMTLEHYPGMTEKGLARIEAEASCRRCPRTRMRRFPADLPMPRFTSKN